MGDAQQGTVPIWVKKRTEHMYVCKAQDIYGRIGKKQCL